MKRKAVAVRTTAASRQNFSYDEADPIFFINKKCSATEHHEYDRNGVVGKTRDCATLLMLHTN